MDILENIGQLTENMIHLIFHFLKMYEYHGVQRLKASASGKFDKGWTCNSWPLDSHPDHINPV